MKKQELQKAAQDHLESAVFSYIQAMRALGKTKLNTADIAHALGRTPTEVEQTLASLRSKGVKKAK